MAFVREIEENATHRRCQSVIKKKARKYVRKVRLQYNLQHPERVTEEGEEIKGKKINTCLRKLKKIRLRGELQGREVAREGMIRMLCVASM